MEIAIVLLAAFGAGILNTIAGGGTFLTFPALVLVSVPPVAATPPAPWLFFRGIWVVLWAFITNSRNLTGGNYSDW